MKLLALDLSTKVGWSVFEDGLYTRSGCLPKVEIEDFNVHKEPNKSKHYPKNLLDASNEVRSKVFSLLRIENPEHVVIEQTVSGRNRHTQRLLEWIHQTLIGSLLLDNVSFSYLDPSEWRYALNMRLSKEDKKNNALVSKGKKRGRITKKHLSVRLCNEILGLKLKLKDNDQADSILLGMAWIKINETKS